MKVDRREAMGRPPCARAQGGRCPAGERFPAARLGGQGVGVFPGSVSTVSNGRMGRELLTRSGECVFHYGALTLALRHMAVRRKVGRIWRPESCAPVYLVAYPTEDHIKRACVG